MSHDAIVVGAGLSGLVCARCLVAAGVDALVVEAQGRVGGRLDSATVGGALVDRGGQWMSVDQPRLLALAGELGVASRPQPRGGRPVIDDATPPGGLFGQIATAIAQWRAVRRITRMARRIPGDEPAIAAGAAELDAIALGPWLAGTIGNPTARERIAMHAELVFAADPAGLSLLAYLARLGATGGFAPRGPDLPGGGRDHCFVGGAQTLALRLAERLGPALRLAQPVQSIERAGDSLVVRGMAGDHQAAQVVLAVPPSLAVRLAPALLPPPLRRRAAAMRPGAVVKWFAAYDRPFWRDAGLSGEAYRTRGTVRAVVDASSPDGPGVLLAFIVGEPAARWHTRDPIERRGELLETLAALFGEPARTPLETLEADWSIDPWSAGCVAGTPPGALTDPDATWRGVHDRLHLAGTEAAVRWPGYMEGAIEAGERAAAQVLAALSR